MERKILLNPGPATTTDSVKQAQLVPDICPREKEFGDLMFSISNDLVKIAQGGNDYSCVLFGGSGTAAMEAAISSVIPEGGKVLIINNGAYGKRFIEMAKAHEINFVEIFFDWNERLNPKLIEETLMKNEDITHIIAIHHETTTGILNPIKELGEISKRNNCVFILDAISSFGGIPFSVGDCNIDFLIANSTKCLQGIAGVCFVICKNQELEKTRDYPKRTIYLNIYDEYKYFKNHNQSRFTPPVQTLYALRKALDEFFEEGAENRNERYKKNYEVLIDGMKTLGFKKIYDDLEESKILTTFFEPEDPNYSFEKMHDSLSRKGFTIYPGKLKERTFRIANMGDINSSDIENFLGALKELINNKIN